MIATDSKTFQAQINEQATLTKLTETYRIVEEIIANLEPEALSQIFSQCGNDFNHTYDILFDEAYRVLFGTRGVIKEAHLGYMDKLAENMEETLRIESLNYFLVSVFPEFDINWHHLEWGNMAQQYRRLAIEAPRDHGKSYYFSNVFPAWKMYRYKPKNAFLANPRPDIYLSEFGALITNEASLGEELLEILKNSIESNPILRERLYPGKGSAAQTSWAMRKIKCRNGARLITKSYGTKFRGRHPGWMVCDDFMDDSSLYSKEQREKFVNYFQSVLMNAVLKEGQVINVGTPFHENDLFGVLKKRKGWRVFVYPAITPDGRVLWPSRYSFQDLMDKRDENGPIAFSREQLCKPIVSDASIFPYSLVSKAFKGMENYRLVQNRESFPIRFNRVVTAGDFAMSANTGADYTVFMTFGIDNDDNRWLLNFWRAKGKTFQEQMLQLRRINTEFRPDCIMLESNQFQQIFVQEADRQGLPVLPHNTNTNKYDMKEGVPGLALTFERQKFRFPRGDQFSIDATDLVASELGSIAYTDKGLQGVGEHDDTVMCLWIAECNVRYVSTGFKFSTA